METLDRDDSPVRREGARLAGRGPDAMKLEVSFSLATTVEDVVVRLSRAMRGTQLRLVRLVGDGEVVYPLRVQGATWRATRWEGFLGPRPGRPLHADDVERCLHQLDEHLPHRSSVALSDVPRPAGRRKR